MTPAKPFKRALRTQAAAKFLNMSTHTLEKWRLTDRGPAYYKIGRKVFYLPEDLVRFAKLYSPGQEKSA